MSSTPNSEQLACLRELVTGNFDLRLCAVDGFPKSAR